MLGAGALLLREEFPRADPISRSGAGRAQPHRGGGAEPQGLAEGKSRDRSCSLFPLGPARLARGGDRGEDCFPLLAQLFGEGGSCRWLVEGCTCHPFEGVSHACKQST